MTQLYDEALAPSGLRITQYALLANLDRHGEIALTELAEAMSMDRTTLTRNLVPLERDGLLVVRLAGRGRTKLAALTAEGRRRLRAALPYHERAQARFRDVVGADGVRNLSAVSATIRSVTADAR